jgi:hypothetical protein
VKAAGGMLIVAVTLTGCATLKEGMSPAPTPPPARSASIPPPSSGPPPPTATPPTPSTPVSPVPAPPRVLSPDVEDEQRVRRDAQTRIDGTERLVRQINPSKLVGEQQQNFLTIQSFLAKAKEALSARDLQRAFTLADKAYVLANELSRSLSR